MSRVTLRRAVSGDLPLLSHWREAAHVRAFWGAPDVEPEAEKLADARVAMWIALTDGVPFAFLQDYGPHDWPGHPFAHLPTGSRGIDFYIGSADMIGRGLGTAMLREFTARLIAAGAPSIGCDPHPDNAASRRVLQKVGFVEMGGPVATPWGTAILAELWAGAGPIPPPAAPLRPDPR